MPSTCPAMPFAPSLSSACSRIFAGSVPRAPARVPKRARRPAVRCGRGGVLGCGGGSALPAPQRPPATPAARSPDGSVRQGAGIVAGRQAPHGVEVDLDVGTTETGGLLVGADGVHSRIRRSLFDDRAPGACAAGIAKLAGHGAKSRHRGVDVVGRGGGVVPPHSRRCGDAYAWISASGDLSRRVSTWAACGVPSRRFPAWSATQWRRFGPAGGDPPFPLDEVRIPAWTATGSSSSAMRPMRPPGLGAGRRARARRALVLADLLAETGDGARSARITSGCVGRGWRMSRR